MDHRNRNPGGAVLVPSWHISLREDVTVSPEGERGLVLSSPDYRLVLREQHPAVRSALQRLAHPGDVEARLTDSVRSAAAAESVARWYYNLQHLARQGWLLVSVRAGQAPLATLVPISLSFTFAPGRRLSDRPHLLSRFAYLRREGDALVLESPLSFARLVLHDARAAALVNALARPQRLEDFAARIPGLEFEDALGLLGLLLNAEMVQEVGANEAAADARPPLQSWEFHDLLFHTRSREGRHDAPLGAVYPQAGKMPLPPACKTVAATEVIDLYRPDMEQLQRQGPSLDWILTRRCSIREYAAEPIATRQLGEFLYRVARVMGSEKFEVETPAGPVEMEFTSRPYPAGGALYELEFYVVVNACAGLAPGLYHYDPHGHRLGRLADRTPEVEMLLWDAAMASGADAEKLQILVIVSARFGRIAWKYASLAYSLILKHVGVVYQTMYLTATAMNLAPCALGTGNSDVFARAAGLDVHEESSVGEFLLGSRPLTPRPPLS